MVSMSGRTFTTKSRIVKEAPAQVLSLMRVRIFLVQIHATVSVEISSEGIRCILLCVFCKI